VLIQSFTLLQGYLVGNPVTDSRFDENFVIPASHGFGIISDQLYEVRNSTSTHVDQVQRKLCVECFQFSFYKGCSGALQRRFCKSCKQIVCWGATHY